MCWPLGGSDKTVSVRDNPVSRRPVQDERAWPATFWSSGMTRQQARERGRSLGLQLGAILAEETLRVEGAVSPAIVAARTVITHETIAGVASGLSTHRKRDEFRVAAEKGVIDALDVAQITVAAVGEAN